MLDDYSAGKCDVLLFGWEDLSMDEKLLGEICAFDLVFTDSIGIEIPMGFPIRSELAKGFSFWMYEGSEKHDISFQGAKEDYLKEAPLDVCNVQLSSTDSGESDMIQIDIENLALPIVFFLLCAFVAGVIHLVSMKRPTTVLGRTSTLSLTKRSIRKGASKAKDQTPVVSENI